MSYNSVYGTTFGNDQKVQMVQKVMTKFMDEYSTLAKKNNKLLHLLPASFWARFKVLTINFKALCAIDN